MNQNQPSSDHDVSSDPSMEGDNEVLIESDHGEEDLPVQAIVFMAGAAVLGAAVWAGIAIGLHRELGWLAWGIGALVGFGCLRGGGFGLKAGVLAAVFAVLAIVGGRTIGLNFIIDNTIEEVMQSPDTQGWIEELQTEADEWKVLPNREDDAVLARFLQKHNYQPQGGPEWDEANLTMARADLVPSWEAMALPSGRQAQLDEYRGELENELTLWEVFKEDLGAIDLLFLGLGVATAFKMASGL